MYQFNLVIIGKEKNNPEQMLIEHYKKLLKPFARIQVFCCKEEGFFSKNEREQVVRQEQNRLQKIIQKNSFIVALDAKGRLFDSETFAQHIPVWSNQEQHSITFIIGGPLGLSQNIKNQAHLCLALSLFTFPHDLARSILMEQLYRAMTILHKKTYHY
ncbi:23S rRNA (pseudouridine(1915)-N(3))-methyltransferase RlmH [Candidatus Uhrbacteria bacterium CG_4_9_14_3_um_filter_36_7]|uniref:Ribosomal RNA large subunit methyltransferase H n=1 Tax=Candidatus Uhrbacteria bacterium CG_4_9_14_3_um_filter_36_7 TaxID=1975033 RepID=A0A2M7XHS0_9BACT|nr:MAG: 23S rRNA (pseudouridine(1915)-N(3))-methyltransferase RlmH [Candidatus Uhrbacteria bacterium CG_4_9_14_3_um_filter_36_7]